MRRRNAAGLPADRESVSRSGRQVGRTASDRKDSISAKGDNPINNTTGAVEQVKIVGLAAVPSLSVSAEVLEGMREAGAGALSDLAAVVCESRNELVCEAPIYAARAR